MKLRDFSKIYFALLLAHLAFKYVGEHPLLIGITKGLLLFSLMAYFLQTQTEGPFHRTKRLFFSGLFFSWIGDILLIFEGDLFFILGLSSFLTAHVFYTFAFAKQSSGYLSKAKYWYAVLGVYLIGFMGWAGPSLGAMLAPVSVYALVISAMVLTAINRKGSLSAEAYKWGIFGAVFFVISDTALAINKFVVALPYEGFIVMGTYGIAQYALVVSMEQSFVNASDAASEEAEKNE
ncbi:MAG: hypothetical protein SchgKO_06820 [Schleiferiaceae bacterium]